MQPEMAFEGAGGDGEGGERKAQVLEKRCRQEFPPENGQKRAVGSGGEVETKYKKKVQKNERKKYKKK